MTSSILYGCPLSATVSTMNTNGTVSPRHMSETVHRKRGWMWLLVPKPFDLVISLLYISVPLLSILFGSDCSCALPSWWTSPLMIAIMLALLTIDRVEYWLYGETTPLRVAIILMVTRVLLIEAIAQLDGFRFSPFLYLIIPLLFSLYFSSLIGYISAGCVWIAYLVKIALKDGPDWLNTPMGLHDLIIFTLGLTFAMAMANAFLRERRSRSRTELLLSALEESHQQLKAYSTQVEELARIKERNRVARDIHDTLGHYLTVINVQLEKALAFREKKPQQADQAVVDAKRLASEALEDVRRSVGALRATEESIDLVPALQALIARMPHNQYDIVLTSEGSEERFSKSVLMTLYRVAQEGLTNVQKHAHAQQVHITLRFTADDAQLSVCDDGTGIDPPILHHVQQRRSSGEGGYGLQGLQERLELVGGHLKIESSPEKGTCIVAIVPKDSPHTTGNVSIPSTTPSTSVEDRVPPEW